MALLLRAGLSIDKGPATGGTERDVLPMNCRSRPEVVILLLFEYFRPTDVKARGAKDELTD
jgi:hypothetical protein